MTETWYLLYTGSSEDGQGSGQYLRRTVDRVAAYAHYKTCANNPYSTGSVMIVTDSKIERASLLTVWQNF